MTRRQIVGIVLVLIVILALAAIFVPVPQLRATLVGGLISVVTATMTLFGQYYLRRGDPLYWNIGDAWSFTSDGPIGNRRRFTLRIINIINTREVGTALWNLRASFYKNGRETLVVTPQRWQQGKAVLVEVVDLPPQQTVTLHLEVAIRSSDSTSVEKAKKADKVKIVAELPGFGTFEENLPAW